MRECGLANTPGSLASTLSHNVRGLELYSAVSYISSRAAVHLCRRCASCRCPGLPWDGSHISLLALWFWVHSAVRMYNLYYTYIADHFLTMYKLYYASGVPTHFFDLGSKFEMTIST